MVKVGKLFYVGDVDSFVFAEVADVDGHALFAVALGVVQLAAAVVDSVGVVVRNALAAQIVEYGLKTAGDDLGACGVLRVAERLAFVVLGDLSLGVGCEYEQEQDQVRA